MATKKERDEYYRLRDRVAKLKKQVEGPIPPIQARSRYKGIYYPSLFPYELKRGRRSFRNDEQFEKYKERLRMILKHGYDYVSVETYKSNFLRMLKTMYGESVKGNIVYDIERRVRAMSGREFLEATNSGRIPSITFLYHDKNFDYNDKLLMIGEGLGLKV